MHERKEAGKVFRYWDISELTQEIVLPRNKDTNSKSSETGSAHFCGTENIEEAIELMTHGDQKSLMKIEGKADRIQVSGGVHDDSLVMIQDVCGGSVNVESYLLGEPNCMTDFVLRKDKSKIVRVMVDYCARCDVTASQLASRGCAIFEIVRAIELSGYTMDLTMVYACDAKEEFHQYEITVKKAGQYLDPAITAFWLCNPSAQRRITFKLHEIYDTKISNQPGYGHVNKPKFTEQTEHLIYLPMYINYDCANPAQISDFMRKELGSRGIEVRLAA